MTWFEHRASIIKPHVRIAHVTDSHLFASRDGEYFNVNTSEHFARVLRRLADENVDLVIFGGDLSQDHSKESYQLFAKLVDESCLSCPVFWVPGNHDDIEQLYAISGDQIKPTKCIELEEYQLLLVNSKGPTPAGWVEANHLAQLQEAIVAFHGSALLFCHHHPIPIQGYLDKHILENGTQLLNICVDSEKVSALVHGHVHNDYFLSYRGLPIYATPATSIQFSRHSATWQQQNFGPAYRLIDVRGQSMATWVKWA
ncbi:3',5'-cyclic-nucleotide phosphodiesterase [Pseudoalteromonas luteoviolacea B = ATCC 29581]|nr:3',5'-cyclic-nucleotide phosphodiesterase [Pseudoalteromonas luteoviolacea B = ATCC 29581]